METAKEIFFRAVSRPGDRTCRPPQRGGKWIIAGYMISHLSGLSFLIVLYTYLFTNQKNFTALFIYNSRRGDKFYAGDKFRWNCKISWN